MNDDLVAVATFGSAMEAEMARNRLKAEGILALIMDCETTAKSWHLTQAIGGVKMLVAVADEDRAVEILEHRIRHLGDIDKANESEHDELHAEEADDGLPTEKELDAERALKAQVFAFLFIPLQLVALAFIVKVAMSRQRLNGRPLRHFQFALALHAFGWLFFALMVVLLSPIR